MTLRSLGLRSDLVAMQGLSHLEAHPAGHIMRTPNEPNYWSGNIAIIAGDQADPLRDIAFSRAQFPKASHNCIVYDLPSPDLKMINAALTPLGFDVDTFDVLTRQQRPAQTSVPQGIVIRELQSETDWDAAFALACEVGVEEGYTQDTYPPYIAGRIRNRRAQIADGLGGWFGAFQGDLLVAQMGLFHDQQIARFQSVETRLAFRRRGICAALLSHVSQWAQDRAPRADQIIVAEADSDAGRLYRANGFALTETLVEATLKGH